MEKNDQQIKSLLAKVDEQTRALGSKPRCVWTTNGIFKFDEREFFNINVERDYARFADALAFLILRQKAFEDACVILGIKHTVFKWQGYTREDWEEDFKTRIATLEYDSRKNALSATKAKLQTLMSDDVKTEMELEAISKLLG